MKKRLIFAVVILVLIAGGAFAFVKLKPTLTITVPEYTEPGEIVQSEQGWTDAQRLEFHHTSQGTRMVPYEWFKAVEQPCFSLFSACEPFQDPKYLSRFGFLSSKQDDQFNPAGLPIGFSYQKDFHDPITGRNYPALGLTCAACHTNEMRYDKYAVRIDGAPAMIEVTQFQKALGLALFFTKVIPGRYSRFEAKVLGPNATDANKKDLKDFFDGFMEAAKAEKDATEEQKVYANQAGFARTDALARIGNQVFAVDMKNNANFRASSAPVRFPQIWDAPWFNWVQYNSSIADPMVRNIGEALGVRAVAKLYGPDAGKLENSVYMPGMKRVEEMLAGPSQFQGLSSPKWPSVFPPLDAAKVARGHDLYNTHCQSCHFAPIPELLADLASPQPKLWWKNRLGKSFLIVKDIPIDYVGTDPNEAKDFMDRKADTGDLGKGIMYAAPGLDFIMRGIAVNYYDKNGFSPEKRAEWSGYRDPADPAVRAIAKYKARPLNGIWAAAPYLHNGAVPNLYLLLSPQSERPATFWLGSRKFDPVKVGYDSSELKGGYLLETANPGNSNKGHEFKDGPRGNGVIGPLLPPDDRYAIIEYLKSL